MAAGQALVVARIAQAQPGDAPALIAALDEYERRCIGLMDAGGDERPTTDSWAAVATNLARNHSIGLIQAELIWCDRARKLVASFDSTQSKPSLTPIAS